MHGCPNCGASELNGKFCAYCGTQLIADKDLPMVDPFRQKDTFDIPVGEYKGCNCNVVLMQDALMIRSFVLGGSGNYNNVVIPYKDISGIFFYRSEPKFGSAGYIVIRWPGNQYLPIPSRKGCNTNNKQETIITYSFNTEFFYTQLFWFLLSMAGERVAYWIDEPTGFAKYSSNVAIGVAYDAYFEKFSPYRDLAANELAKRTKLKKVRAEALIHKAFDIRQERLYMSDPKLAIRDFNRIIQYAIRGQWSSILGV